MLDFYLQYKYILTFTHNRLLIHFKLIKLINKIAFLTQKHIASKLFQINFNHLNLFKLYKFFFYKIIIKKKSWKIKHIYLTQFQQYIY